MKRISISVLLAFSLWLASSCNKTGGIGSSMFDDGKLTAAKAESTLKRWVTDGEVAVRGIQDLPKENAAKVDLNFTNLKFRANNGFGNGERNYTGAGTAIFTHYNDGRWVLTKVTTNQSFNSVWWDNLSVEVY